MFFITVMIFNGDCFTKSKDEKINVIVPKSGRYIRRAKRDEPFGSF